MNPSPTQPQVTPPVTAPNDVTGTPTPPHHVPPGHGHEARDTNKGRGHETHDTSTSQGTASDRDDQATPPSGPPAAHGNDKNGDKNNKNNKNNKNKKR